MSIRHRNKLILSIALVAVLVISIFPVNSFALSELALGGLMQATMQAGGISITNGVSATANNEFWEHSTSFEQDWTDSLGTYRVYYQKNAKTEQGITYDYVYLSHSLAAKAASEGLDFLNMNNITSNTIGYFLKDDEYGTADGLIVTLVNNVWRTPTITFNSRFQAFGIEWYNHYENNDYYITETNISTQTTTMVGVWASIPQGYIYKNGSFWTLAKVNARQTGTTNITRYNNYPVVTANGDLAYDAGDINLSVGAIAGLGFYVKSGYINNRNTGDVPAVDQEDFFDELNNAAVQNDITDSAFTNVEPTPTPTPTPVPTDPVSDIDYATLINDIGTIVEDQTEDINDTIGLGVNSLEGAIDTVGQSIEDKLDDVQDTVDTVGQSIEDKLDDVNDSVTDAIGTQTTTVVGWLQRILSAINEGVADIVDAIEAVAEAVLEGLDDFVTDILGDVPSVFGGWFNDLSDAFGIWHYVVEWFNCISGYFTFLRTIASGMPACFWSPVLAVVAGTIVLGVYKRFLQ